MRVRALSLERRLAVLGPARRTPHQLRSTNAHGDTPPAEDENETSPNHAPPLTPALSPRGRGRSGAPSARIFTLREHDEQLLRLGMLAERYFAEAPNTCLLKLRQLAEVLTQLLASRVGLFATPQEPQYDLLRRLQDQGILPREATQVFHEVRRAGNAASHALAGDHRSALGALKMSWQIGPWFHRTFKDPGYKSGPFTPPTAPKQESAELREELGQLSKALEDYRRRHEATEQRLEATEAKLREAKDEQSFWEQMATEADQAKNALEARLAEQQTVAAAQPRAALAAYASAANAAAEVVELDEADTRTLIANSSGRLAGKGTPQR